MKKEFDFDDIGKKTPYRVPEGFFDEMQRNVRKHTYGGKPAGHRLWISFYGYCHSCGIGRLSVYAVSFQGR